MMTLNAKQNAVRPTLTGDESVAELREMILDLTVRYSGCKFRHNFYIRLLSGLTYASCSNLLNGFDREFCLEILNEYCNCLNEDDGPAN